MACSSVVSHWCKGCMLPCSQRALILVLEHVGNFGVRLPPGCSRRGVSVHCLCVQILSFYATRWPVFPTCMQLTLVSWYVASTLCCHCWDVQLEWCFADVNGGYPSVGYGSFVRPCRSLCGMAYLFIVSYRSMFLHEIGGILWLTLWRYWLHSCGMFILLECSFY